MPRTAETASFAFNHTMIRVKDPKVSLQFYTEIIGMDLLSEKDFGDFTLYFLAFDHSSGALSAKEKAETRFSREGVLELTHNHGTESDPTFQGYANGNADPGRGFGHIAITVDDVEKACERFEQLGVAFKKKPSDGKMRHIAFILDPDGYWIEIVPRVIRFD
ncbi:Glyoxalase/Bleomycin resistance protein/Dihydroxybiphenyl dioxygenase [Armillaria luteobubalina]|uniref:lactoylglutathione lyase n=1 Tax=Armillaria luteobubalina TaxID=153913 RepID=A0AA39UVL5_9AGAR|nr:Glyoxalase/Bleomycin resistance protein/Dihydroxybiphenyl dioxygenase [Armillaria luteobubalina]